MIVNKADGFIRITCNYKKLDESTIIPVLPLPIIEEFLHELGGAKIFLCSEITSGYFKVVIHDLHAEWSVRMVGHAGGM